jgi:hypothetical protein
MVTSRSSRSLDSVRAALNAQAHAHAHVLPLSMVKV